MIEEIKDFVLLGYAQYFYEGKIRNSKHVFD